MEFNLELPQNEYFVRAVGLEGIRINQALYTQALIISSRGIVPDWNVSTATDIDEERLVKIFEFEPEVVLIGTGKSQVFLPLEVQKHFFQRGIGFEVMKTDAACRTFNVLAAEGREVVAGLIPLT
jgi:uncharacterized protein